MSQYHRVIFTANRYSVHIDSALYNGRLSPRSSSNFGFTNVGCPYRGTTTCYACEYEPVMICDYKCAHCDRRWECRCGHDQTVRLQAWGLVP